MIKKGYMVTEKTKEKIKKSVKQFYVDNPELRKNVGKHFEELWQNSKYRENHSGKNHYLYKDGRWLKKYYCIDCGKKLAHYPAIRCKSCDSKAQWQNPEFKKKLNKHHIDLDGNNNRIIMLTNSKHRQLHSRAYDYLVGINKIDDYIKWFDKKFGIREA